MYSVELTNGKKFTADHNESLLDCAARAGLSLNYSCKIGRCSSCRCKVIQGMTDVLQAETGLSEDEKGKGWILSCVRAARSDLIIETEDLIGFTLPTQKILPCRIESLRKVAPDVVKAILRLPSAAEFEFVPGQYIDIIGRKGIRRSYSLAKAGATDCLLELHIRAVEGGAMSDYWFREAGPGDVLRLHGPLGTFFLRRASNVDLIFLATGTGIAPVKAILESLPELAALDQPRSVTVLWGGRSRTDIYFDVAGLPGDHHFVPVLSRADQDWAGARGYVQNVLLALQPDLTNAMVYACGSEAMIRSAKATLVQAGLPAEHFYSDAFVCSDRTPT